MRVSRNRPARGVGVHVFRRVLMRGNPLPDINWLLQIAHSWRHDKWTRTPLTSLWQSESIRNRAFADRRVLSPLANAAVPPRSAPRTSRFPLPPR